MTGTPRPVPPPGPLQDCAAPELMAIDHATAQAMLDSALAGVDRGAWDETVLTWLATKDPAAVATFASLMRRCWQAGAAAGRAEVADELAAVREWREVSTLVHKLRAGGAP